MKRNIIKSIIAASLLILVSGIAIKAFVDDLDIRKGPMAVMSHEEIVYIENAVTVADADNNNIIYSHPHHFYDDSIILSFSAAAEDITEIYYTMDATSPSGDGGILFTEEFELYSGITRINAHTVKVCGKRADGTFTDTQTHTYFIGADVFERFDTLIFSLSTDPYNLFDNEYGIAVPGKLRTEYIKETGDRDPDPPAPANYNLRGREAERPVFVELFDQNGQLILSQNAGIRTFGGWSRASDQKSFKLFARNVYEQGKGTFDFDFFPENTTYYGRAITDYSRLVLRNNGNDNPFGFLRDNTVSALASAILPDTQSTRPAAVFLNGAYYGFVWIHQVYHADYFDDHNEIKNGEWAIVEGGENWKSADPLEPLEVKAVEDYEEMYRYHEWDLTDDDIFAAFCELVDIENFLAYYAVQIYANNNDWPWGNYKAYRYYGEADSLINDGISTADGKWRWLLYDTDWTLGLYNSKASDLTLAKLLGVVRSDRLSSPLLISILERDDMKNRFITILCDIMNYHFSPQNIEHKVRLKEAERINELTHNFKVGGAALKNTWSSLDFVSGQLESMIEFGNKRPAEMQKQIEKYLEVGPTGYIINVKAHDLTDIKLSTINITEDFSGFYYFDNVVTVKADRPVGYDFSHWLVNGDIITDEILSVSKYTVENGEVNIELALKKAEVRMPVITLIDYKGSRDYIEIFNPYEQDIDLRNFFISDDPERPFRQIIAPYLLKPGERKMIYCENHQNAESFGGIKLDFSLKSGETLIITDKRGELVYELFLPDIDSGYILSLDMRNGNYIGKKRT